MVSLISTVVILNRLFWLNFNKQATNEKLARTALKIGIY